MAETEANSSGSRLRTWSWRALVIGLVMIVTIVLTLNSCSRMNYKKASRESANLAPDPAYYTDAVVMAFRAKVWGVRGLFADHTWLATKGQGADQYTVYEVIGWRKYSGRSVVRIAPDVPDRHWFGSRPHIMSDVRGEKARPLVARIDAAARSYPYPDEYSAFPGPNSNTFTAWIAKQVPELGLKLPMRAIGRGYN